ncbi:kinase-like domain-containing protein [Mycena amicta]|nr:kinase-like domain-containing protein [Mycena amicta]
MKSIQYDLDLSTETVNWHIPHEWLVDNREQLRSMLVQDVVDVVSFVGLVENVYWAWRIPPALPLRFTTSVFAKLLKQQQSDSDDGRLDHLRASFHSWKNWNALTSLINFRTVLSTAIALANYIKGDSLPTSLINVLIHTDILCVCAQMTDILKDPVSYEDFLNTSGEDAQKLLDLIQDLLDYPLLHERVRPVILKALLKLSSKSKLHPRCFTLSDRLQLGEHPIAAGSFADVWKGTIRNETVSVKIMRVYLDNDVETLLREISQEGLIWRQLAHPNLLPFFGAYYLQGAHGRLCLVSPWMENGDISRYLKTNLSADKLSLTLDVALGLEHLHSLKLVHGDLKAVNILVTRSGRAVLADFGLSSITDSKITTSGSIAKAGGTVRWQAPELFRGNSNSFASDVYAFACVCYEIFTGNIPFYDLPNDVAVMFHVVQGGRPKHPDPHPRTGPSTRTGLPVSLWRLMQQCWSENPKDRPTATEIVFRLRDSPIGAVRTDPSADPDWDPWSTSKFRSSLEEHTLFLSCGAMEDWVQFIRRPPTRSHTTEAFLSARKASLSACDVPVHV